MICKAQKIDTQINHFALDQLPKNMNGDELVIDDYFDLTELANSLTPTVKEIIFDDVSDNKYASVFNFLRVNQTCVSEMSFRYSNYMSENTATSFSLYLGETKTLKNFSTYRLTTEFIDFLVPALSNNTTIEVLWLFVDDKIDQEYTTLLLESICHLELKKLFLDCLSLPNKNLVISCEKLEINSCDLTKEFLCNLDNSTLRELEIWSTSIAKDDLN